MLESCWPSCIILVSIFRKNIAAEFIPAVLSPKAFSIMAANKMIEIPEKTKLEVFLNKDEEKYLLVDLKYAM